METLDLLIPIAYVVVNGFSLLQVIGSYRWPAFTRVIFFVIFALAAFVNTRTVLDTPWVYQSYADYAIPVYSWFILVPFESIIQPMVLSIAFGQALIAVSMFMKRQWFRAGSIGGIIFLVAISPLGLGAAFPSTLLLAVAFYRLYRHEDRKTIGEIMAQNQIPLPLD